MIRTEDEAHFDVHQLVAREIAALQSVFDTLLGRLDELARNRAARNRVFKHEAFARRWLNLQLNVAVFTATARLLFEDFFTLSRFRDRLTIGCLRLSYLALKPQA